MEIVVKTEKLNDVVQLSVINNGHGISKQNHEMIFERYTRIVKQVEGTGMGLYIVRTMVENNGGTVAVESALGVGSNLPLGLRSNTRPTENRINSF